MLKGIASGLHLPALLFIAIICRSVNAADITLNPDFADAGELYFNLTEESDSRTSFSFRQAARLNDGSFLLAFDEVRPVTYFHRSSVHNFSSVSLIKVGPDGDMDLQYGDAGIYTIPLEHSDRVIALEKLSNGKIMLLTETFTNSCSVILSVWRLDSNGSIDTTFADNGKATKHFGDEGVCWRYDYSTYFVMNQTVLTNNDELFAVVSGPGDYNSSFNGELLVSISQTGDINVRQRTTCDILATASGQFVCGWKGINSDDTSYNVDRHDVSENQTTQHSAFDFTSLLNIEASITGLDFNSHDLVGNEQGYVYSLLTVSRTTYTDGVGHIDYKKRLLFRLNALNEFDSAVFNDGMLTESEQPLIEKAERLFILPDDDLLISGPGFISKITSDGETSTGYGESGTFNFNSEEDATLQWLYDAQNVYVVQSNQNSISIISVNAQGRLNTGFADNGELTFSIDNVNSEYTSAYAVTTATSLAATTNDRLQLDIEKEGTIYTSRVTNAGEVAPEFGTDGLVQKDVTEEGARKRIQYTDSGAFLVLTASGLYKYLESGELDMGFAASGVFQTNSEYRDMLLTDSGHILLAREEDLTLYLLRLTADGTPDNTFGSDGYREIHLGSDGLDILAEDAVLPVADKRTPYIDEINPASRLLFLSNAPESTIDVHFKVSEGQPHTDFPDLTIYWSCFYKVRFDSNGQLSAQFAEEGVYRFCMDEEHHTWGEEPVPLAQFQLDDKTLQIASYEWFDVDNQTLMSAGLAFISLSADGAQISHTKRTFQELSPALSSSISQKVLGATLQPDNKVIIAVQFGEKPVQMALFRFLPDGTPDINFADNGVYLSESDRDFTDYSDFTMLHDQIYLSGERHHQGIVINLTEQNFPPEIIEDSPAAMQLTEDSLSSELIIQASDDNGDGLEWFVSHMPEKGTLTLNPAGEQASVLYQPDTNASGSDNFEVTVQDWRGAQQSHQINVMISPINDVPEISLSGSSTTINPGMAVTITADIHDVDNDQLSLVWSQESGVSIDLNNQQDNSLTFTAPEVTEISQIVVKATVSDGQAEASATMTMTIEPATDNQQAQPSSGGALQYLLLLLLLTSGPRMFKQRGI